MDRKQAQRIIKETFENSFDEVKFVYFIKSLLNYIKENNEKAFIIPGAYEQYISTLKYIGEYTDGENEIDILIVELKRETSLEQARTMQRNFISWYLNGGYEEKLKDAALVAFVSPNKEDWRFSLVKMNYKFEEKEDGKMKTKEEITPARRWSFLVGKNEKSHTAQSEFVTLLMDTKNYPTLAQLEESFNIEKVTKEFFEKYRGLFLWVKEELDKIVSQKQNIKDDFNSKNINTIDFAKKLLGQITFLYFLQKKGWFGVERDAPWGTGPKNFLRELFEKKQKYYNYDNFFSDILEPLFYEALRSDRSYDNHYFSMFKCKIPFLNGGLFDPMNDYDWKVNDILLPNELFSNSNKTEEDIGNGILDIFDRYNFTVKEDEPLEKEVAIDPEMLGKTYEKFNAIRPDNYEEYKNALQSAKKGAESKFNKQYGVYYTPREIVHYMCQQSLINYLTTELGDKISKEAIEFLILRGEEYIEHLKTAKEKKEEGKISSPYKEDEYFIELKEYALDIDEYLSNVKICDPAVGSGALLVGMMTEIVKARLFFTETKCLGDFYENKQGKKLKRNTYNYKRLCIQNSLYGVDIDPGAVEIAKLRLWLSLIVDEENIEDIKPLPNLDYKIVRGNSLLGVKEDVFNYKLFSQLEKLKPLHFDETNNNKKHEYKKQIDDIIFKITNGHKEFDFEIYFSEVFHEKKGFDVVIANPPYDVYEGRRQGEIEEIRKYPIYEKATGGKLNAYKLFLAKSSELQKPGGILCEIFQNSFLADNSASKIRKHFLEMQRIFKIDSFPERYNVYLRVFENVKMSVCILTSQNKTIKEYQFLLRIYKDKYMNLARQITLSNLDIISLDSNNATIPSIDQKEFELLKKISKITRLKNFARCYEGEINLTFHKKFLKKEKNGYTRMIKGAAVQKWFLKEKMSQGDIEYLDQAKYFEENAGNKSQHFKLKRIVLQGITGVDEKYRLKMTIIDPGIFCGNSVNYILINDKTISDAYLLALLNSKLLNWSFKTFSTNSNVNGYEVGNLPIPKISSVEQKPFIDLVDKILAITKDDDYLQNPQNQAKVLEYEKQIDQMVYQLYGLTDNELEIIANKS